MGTCSKPGSQLAQEPEKAHRSVEKLLALKPPPVDLDRRDVLDVAKSVTTVLKAEDESITRKVIAFTTRLSRLPKVWANDWLVRQTIRHLIQNGVRASKFGATIRISGSVKKDCLEIRFIDSGRGIPQRGQDFVLEKLLKNQVPGKVQVSVFCLVNSIWKLVMETLLW